MLSINAARRGASSEAASDAKSGDNYSWIGGFEALESELSQHELTRVSGPPLSAALGGTLFRNGGGRNEGFGERNGHWFDGDGMVCAFRFEAGRVLFSNRYVQTQDYVAEQRAGRRLKPRGGTLTGRRVRDMLPILHNTANVNVVHHQGRLIALSDLGRPVTIDPSTLETLGEETFGGRLRRRMLGTFPAHPHYDPVSGALVNVGPCFSPTMLVRCQWQVVEIPERGPLQSTVRFSSHRPFWTHDFGLTQSKVIVVGSPRYLELGLLAEVIRGGRPLLHGLAFHPDEPSMVYVVDRKGLAPTRTYEIDPGLVFHFANAYDDGDDVVVDLVHHPDDGGMELADAFFKGEQGSASPGTLTRFTFRADGSSRRDALCEFGAEMPTVSRHCSTLAHRFIYVLRATREVPIGSTIMKVDTKTGRTQMLDFGPGQYVSEPVFAPVENPRAEDDGFVLTLVYDATVHRSYLAVSRADAFEGPVTKVHLPFHVPHGFHGTFVAGL